MQVLGEDAALEQEFVVRFQGIQNFAPGCPGSILIAPSRTFEFVQVDIRAAWAARFHARFRRGPPCSMAENARYGLADGSGGRNSMRRALGLSRVRRNADAGASIALRVRQIDRRFVARNQTAVRVGGWRAKREHRRSVGQQSADVVACGFAQHARSPWRRRRGSCRR